MFREQSPYPVSSPPYKEGFYYTVPARLLLYQPPPGQSYPAGRAIAKEHGNCYHQRDQITLGEYDESPQRKYKRSNDEGISDDVLPQSNIPGGSTYSDYYDAQSIQTASDYRKPGPSSSAAKFSGSIGHLDVLPYNSVSPDEVQDAPGHLSDSAYRANKLPNGNVLNSQRQYSQRLPVSYGESNQGVPINSQLKDHQSVLVKQSAANTNNRLQDSWPQSSGPIPNPAENYGIGSKQNLYEKYPSVPHPYPNSRAQLNENFNTQHGSYDPDRSSAAIYRQDGVDGDSGPEAQPSKIPMSPIQFPTQPIVNHHGDITTDSKNGQSSSDFIVPQSSQIPPSYLVGVKILTNAPSSPSSAQGRPLWDLPNFPKHMVEPWAFKMNSDGAYSAGRSNGFQSRPIDSSRPAVRDLATSPIGFRPPPHSYPPSTRAGTPWVVLMVPKDSLFRKDYNRGMKMPWLSFSPKIYGTNGKDSGNQAGIPPCRKGNLGVAESQISQSNGATDIKKGSATDLQYPVLGSLESVEQVGPMEVGGARSLVTHSNTMPQSQNQKDLTHEKLDQTITAGGNIVPSAVTKDITSGRSGSRQLTEHTGEDQVISRALENEATSAREVHPRGTVQTIIEEVINGSPTQDITLDSQLLAGHSTEMGYANVGGTESARERLHTESLILGKESTQKTINYANSGYTSTKQENEESGMTSSGTTLYEGTSKLINSPIRDGIGSASSVEHTMTVGGENLVESMDFQKVDKVVEANGSALTLGAPSGSNVIPNVDTGMAEQEGSRVVGSESSSTMIEYNQPDGLAAQQVNHLGPGVSNGPESINTILGEVPSTSKIVQYVTTGRAAQDSLHEANFELKNEGSSSNAHYIRSGGAGIQQVESDNALNTKTTLTEGGNSLSQAVSYVSEGNTGMHSQLGNMAGGNTATGSTDSTGSQHIVEQSNSFGPTTVLGDTPSSSKSVRYITTGGAEQKNIDEASLLLKTAETSNVTRYINSGGTGAQQIMEQGPNTKATHVEGGGSTSQVIRYVTEGISGTNAHVKDLTVGQEGHSTLSSYNYTGGTSPHEFTEQTNSLGSTTTYLNGAPSPSNVIQYVTSGGTDGGNLDEGKIPIGNESSSTVTRYVSSGGSQKIMGGGGAYQTVSTLVNGGHSGSQVVGYGTEGNKGTHTRDLTIGNEGQPTVQLHYNYSDSQQPGDLGSNTTILGGAPSTTKIDHYVTSEEPRVGNLGEAKIASGNEGVSTVTHYVTSGSSGTQQTLHEGKTQAVSKLVDGGGLTAQVVSYETEGITGTTPHLGSTNSGGEGRPGVLQYNYTGGTGPQQVVEQASGLESTTTISGGAPSTSKTIRYVTSGETDRENVGEGTIAAGNGGYSTVTRYVSSGGSGTQQITVEGETPHTTLVDGGNSGSQVIRYITEGSRGVTSHAEGTGSENNGRPMVPHYNSSGAGFEQVLDQASALQSTTPILNGAASTSKIIHYTPTVGAFGENLGESNIAPENEDSSTLTRYIASGSSGTQQINKEGKAPQTISALVNGGDSTSQVVHYMDEGSRVSTPDAEDMISRQNVNVIATSNNYPSSTDSQQVVKQVNGVGSTTTTILGGDPSSSNIIRYITTGGAVGHNLGERKLASESEGPTTVPGTHQRIQQPDSLQFTTTIIDAAPLAKSIRYVATGGEGQESANEFSTASGNVGASPKTHVIEGFIPQTALTEMSRAPESPQVIRYITENRLRTGLGSENYTTLGNEGDSITTRYNNTASTGMQQVAEQDNAVGATPILLGGGPSNTSKIIRYVTTGVGGEDQSSEVEFGPSTSARYMKSGSTDGVSKSRTTFVSGAPAKSKIIRYITTANGEEIQEITGDSSFELENEGPSSLTGYGNNGNARHIMEGITQHIETKPAPITTSKIIRYVTNAGVVGQESHDDSSINQFRNDVPPAAEENRSSGSQTIRYLNAGSMGIEQQLGQPMTVSRVISTGGTGTQQVIEQDATLGPTATVLDGSPSTYRTIRYVSSDGANPQHIADTSNANQPSQPTTRYITLPNSDSASDGQSMLQQGGSTVTRYVTMPGSGGESSQFSSGQGNLQSSRTIIPGGPSSVTRYLNYPQQSGVGGMRYTQNFQPRTSTIMKPVSYVSGALPGSAQQPSMSYVMSPAGNVVTKTY